MSSKRIIIGLCVGFLFGFAYVAVSEFWFGATLESHVGDVFWYSAILLWMLAITIGYAIDEEALKLLLKISLFVCMTAHIIYFFTWSKTFLAETILSTFMFMTMPTTAFFCAVFFAKPPTREKALMFHETNKKQIESIFRIIAVTYFVILVLQWFPYGIIRDWLEYR